MLTGLEFEALRYAGRTAAQRKTGAESTHETPLSPLPFSNVADWPHLQR